MILVISIKLKVDFDDKWKDVPFLSKVTVEGSILKRWYCFTGLWIWLENRRRICGYQTGTVSGGNVASMEALLSSAAWKEAVGKTVELYIFRK